MVVVDDFCYNIWNQFKYYISLWPNNHINPNEMTYYCFGTEYGVSFFLVMV